MSMIMILGYSLITVVFMIIMIKKYFKNNIKIIIPLKHGWTKNNFETAVTNCGFKIILTVVLRKIVKPQSQTVVLMIFLKLLKP